MELGRLDIILFCVFVVIITGKEASHHLVQMYPKVFSLNFTPINQEVVIIIGTEEGPIHPFLHGEEEATKNPKILSTPNLLKGGVHNN